MKNNINTYCLLLILAIFCMACSNNDGPQSTSSYMLHLDSSAPTYNTQTRAKSDEWQNGDVIFFLFLDGDTKTIESRATYNASSRDWTMEHIDNKFSHNEGVCKVHHFRGGTLQYEANTVSINEHTASFADISASYLVIDNDIYVSARLQPQTWRIAFKGERGKELTVSASSNIEHYSSYTPTNGLQSKTASDYHLTILSDGYTDYIYGSLSASPSTLRIIFDNKIYCRLIDNSLLSVGQSGYFKLPTQDNAYGWDYGGLNSTEISLDGFSTDRDLDSTTGSPTEQTGSQKISIDGNSDDKNLDNTTGDPTESTGSQDITIEGYGPDKNLD